MTDAVRYDARSAPKLGAVFNSIGSFSPRGKELGEERFRALFEDLKRDGAIRADSILKARIFGPHEAMAVADEFAGGTVDAILIFNSAFPNGHVFPTLALHPHLSRTPVIVSADCEAELGDAEWTTNAWCGVIMNNHVASQLRRHIRPLAGNPAGEAYRGELRMLLNCWRAVALMRRDVLGRFGDAPGGFHSATVDQMALLRVFGTRVDTVDLLGVMAAYRSGKAAGPCGEAAFSDADAAATAAEMKAGRRCLVDGETLRKGARFYHAMKAQVEANGYTSVALRCWPELCHPEIAIAPCFPLTWLLTKGVVRAASCESDCGAAVMQGFATLLSGKPAACLDFVDYTGRRECVELGHCGVGIAGCMAAGETIGYRSPDRQAGVVLGPCLTGQFEYGPKTGVTIAGTPGGGFKVLCFAGESSPATAQGKQYCAADVRVPEYRALDRLILDHGFPHHLAVAMADITREIAEVCAFLGIECLNPRTSV